MAVQEETAPWKQWCLEHTCTLLQRKFPNSAIWIVRPSRMLRCLFSCYHNFVQSSLIGTPSYNSTYGCLPQLEGLLKDAVQRVIRKGQLDMDVRNALQLPIILIGFSKGCVVLNQITHELVNYLIPDSPRLQLPMYGHSLYRSRLLNYSQSTPSIPSETRSTLSASGGSGWNDWHTGRGQRSQPSSPSIRRNDRLSSTEVSPDAARKRFASPESSHRPKRIASAGASPQKERVTTPEISRRNDRLASPEISCRTERLASPEISRRSNRLASPEISRGYDRPASPEISRRNERLGSPEISRRNERLSSPEIPRRYERVPERVPSLDIPHLNESLSGSELSQRNERLNSPEVFERMYSESGRSRSRLSSTSSTKSERGYTSDSSRSSLPPFRSSSFGASASKHIITPSEDDIRNLTEFLRRIKAIYWLDAGHSGGQGAWVTDSELLSMLASLGSEIHVHVTPQQICDPHRVWIGEEEREFVDKLRAFGASVFERVHFEQEERSTERHFGVLDEF